MRILNHKIFKSLEVRKKDASVIENTEVSEYFPAYTKIIEICYIRNICM